MANSSHRRKPLRHAGPPLKRDSDPGMNIVAFTQATVEEWNPTEHQLENQINSAIEDIRSILQDLQKGVGASDRYVLGILDVIADDYRAQLPSGKS